ncbi:Microcin H47 immunity protein mchI [Serratia rubidaea]|nr:Microcin H47 immunity protein mchI [Serratia rubidaea]
MEVLNRTSAVLSLPLTILCVSFSSLTIMGEHNSLVDVFLSVIVFFGFLNLFRIAGKLIAWFNGNANQA